MSFPRPSLCVGISTIPPSRTPSARFDQGAVLHAYDGGMRV